MDSAATKDVFFNEVFVRKLKWHNVGSSDTKKDARAQEYFL